VWHLIAAAAQDDVIGPALGILGLAGLIGGVWAVFRVKGTQATIDLLEQSVRIERSERLALEQRCRQETAILEGRIATLTHEFAEVIAVAVARAVKS
jgi:hypothetical protein